MARPYLTRMYYTDRRSVPRIIEPGETLSSTRYERRAGGKGANQAVAVAKAGGKVSIIASVGRDGGWVVNGLQDAGVDIEPVSVVDGVC